MLIKKKTRRNLLKIQLEGIPRMHKLTLIPLLGYDNETIREIADGYFISSLINIHTRSSHFPKFFCLPKFMESIIFTFIGTFVLTSPRSSFLVPHHMAPSFQNCEIFFFVAIFQQKSVS